MVFFIANQPKNIQNKPMQWEQERIHTRGFYHQMTILIFYHTKYVDDKLFENIQRISEQRIEWKREWVECVREYAKKRTNPLDSRWTISTLFRKSRYYHSSLTLNLLLHGDAYEQPHNFISFIKPTIKLNNAVINSN